MNDSGISSRPNHSKMEIYNDILEGIDKELRSSGEVKPTRVQQRCNLAYDKFSRYLGEMAAKELIHRERTSITAKGLYFLQDRRGMSRFGQDIGIRYLGCKELTRD